MKAEQPTLPRGLKHLERQAAKNPYAFKFATKLAGAVSARRDNRKALRQHETFLPKDVMGEDYDASLVRQIEFLEKIKFEPKSLKGQEVPYIINLDVSGPKVAAFIDHNWQRKLRSENLNLMVNICNNFVYRRLKVPNGIIWPNGNLFITDGQTEIYAALHHPEINSIPVFVTNATEEDLMAVQVDAFVGINMDRRPVPSTDLFAAEVCAKVPEAMEVLRILKKYKITALREAPRKKNFLPLQTMAIGTMRQIYRMQGSELFDYVCKALNAANYRPIRKEHLHALVYWLKKAPNIEKVDFERLGRAVRSIMDGHARSAAQLNANKKGIPFPQALAQIYNDRYRSNVSAEGLLPSGLLYQEH